MKQIAWLKRYMQGYSLVNYFISSWKYHKHPTIYSGLLRISLYLQERRPKIQFLYMISCKYKEILDNPE